MVDLRKKGHLGGGHIHLELRYAYLARWEISSRLGIGFIYANIPEDHFKKPAFSRCRSSDK